MTNKELIEKYARDFSNKIAMQLKPSNDTMEAVRLVRKELPNLIAQIIAETGRERDTIPVGFLRQWINEDRTKPGQKFVTDEEVRAFLYIGDKL